MIHTLKCWPEHFEAVITGRKTFEIRKNDRRFHVGDTLFLQEFEPETDTYTGSMCMLRVTHILSGGQFGLAEGYVCMSVRPV